jgi:hypothetical protein
MTIQGQPVVGWLYFTRQSLFSTVRTWLARQRMIHVFPQSARRTIKTELRDIGVVAVEKSRRY